MKEATSELNATVIVVLAVAAFAAFFFSYLWPLIDSNLGATENCSKATCKKCDGISCETVTCWDKDDTTNTFQCPFKG